MKDWHDTQNEEYLQLLRGRLREQRLLWVDQFVSIVNRALQDESFCQPRPTSLTINDYGCNVGHFFRGIPDIAHPTDYSGYDISETYLSIARMSFGEHYFHLLDVADAKTDGILRSSNIAVVSATLEHIDYYDIALKNVFSRTTDLVIIRTFLGDISRSDRCTKHGARSSYLIRQFTVDELTGIPLSLGWRYTQERDLATGGSARLVCNETSVPRRQTVLVFRKR